MCAADENRKKSSKPVILKVKVVHGHRCQYLCGLQSSSLVFLMISGMSVPICNRFHAKRANSSKILKLCNQLLHSLRQPRLDPSSIFKKKFCTQILSHIGYIWHDL